MKEFDLSALVRENIKRLKPYSSARDEFEGAASVFLDANENPFGTGHNRYPDPHQRKLKEAIAKIKNVATNQVFLGNGSDEAIDLLFRVFCEPGRDSVIIPQPTYGMYGVSAGINNVEIITTTLTPTFDLQANDVLAAIKPGTKMIFLCSPNNPSGNQLSTSAIDTLLSQFSGLVVVDEAYIDFTSTPSWTTRLAEHKNLVVLQTLSKAWGLASLRLGMCFAHPEIIALLNKIKPPYNISGIAQREALAALQKNQSQKEKWVTLIKEQREKLKTNLRKAGCVKKIFPSDANFLLVEVSDAKIIYQQLVQRGVIVRDRSNVILCDNCLRITVGTEEENTKLIQVLTTL
ncbi:MAG: histidinol-phosphate transaminase [Cyclobacteriaceae bacterium]|nr:histidinol-phosphate transaminase [Cyclobacteriaceae bacterium]